MTLGQIIKEKFGYRVFSYSGNEYRKPSLAIKNVSYPDKFIEELISAAKIYNIGLDVQDIIIEFGPFYKNIIIFLNHELPPEGLYDTTTKTT